MASTSTEDHGSATDADLATSTSRKRGRQKGQTTHPVHDIFIWNEDANDSSCTVSGCTKKVPGRHAGNLMTHLKTNHKDVHRNVEQELKGSSSDPAPRRRKTTILNGVEMSGPALQLHCTRLISQHGQSFKSLNYSAFQDIIQPMIKRLPASERIAISSHSIPPKISGFADRVRAKISQEVEDKMVSVQVDGCSKKHRRFIGIRIQHINDKKMVVRTLAVEELFLPSTAANLKAVIMRVLRKYGIPLKSVVSFTTDTGQNYVLAGKLLNLGDDESSDDDDDGVFNFPADLELTQDNISIQSVRCAAHTLQLAVEDAKNLTTEMKPTIDAVRKLVLFLRNEKQVRQIKENNQNMPSLDVCTRWGSTYDMLQSLQMLRNFLDFNLDWTPKDRAENNLSDDQWDEVDSIIEDLQPARRATTKLQVESLTLGEFFGIWQELVMTLEKAATPFAKKLVDAMDKRAKAQQYRQRNRGEKLPPLFNYPAFNASVFLDPRYFSLLDGEEVKEAKTYLLELWERLQRVKGPQISPEDVHVEDDDASSGAESSSGDEYDFAKFLAARNKERIALTSTSCRPGGTPTQHAAAAKLKKSLDEYDNTERPLGVKEDVFKWWEDKRLLYPELYELSKIVLAISATQVSVERLFSALRYILRPQRFGLQAANIDDVVLMHTNADLVEELARELLTEEKEDKDKGAIRDQSGSSLTCTFPSRSSSL